MSDLATFAHDMFASVDAHDIDALEQRIAPDVEFAAPGFTATGAQAVLGFMTPFLVAFPDIAHRIVRTVEVDDTVAIELQITGTHTEPLASPGGELPPTGKRLDLAAANVWRVADGKIASYHVYFDTGTLMAQLGFAPG